MAEEADLFAFDDVAAAISDKLVRRHPHVFADAPRDGDTLRVSWERDKAAERAARANAAGRDASVLDDVPPALPALTRAEKLQKRAARGGFDWAELGPVIAKLEEELGELKAEIADGGSRERMTDEMGDLLFSCVNLARHLKIDPEESLRGTNAKFERRFRFVETSVRDEGLAWDALDIDDYEERWQRAKRADL